MSPLLSVIEPSPAVLDALLRDQSERAFSYREVGGTRTALPAGYRHARQVVELGRGEAVFARAVDGLREWRAHRRGGVQVRPPGARPEEGQTVVLAVPVAAVWVTVACRIVYVIEQPERAGFAYGTLPHHVIEGEEAFLIERDPAGTVRFVVSAFLRPHGPRASPFGPLVHALDQRIVRRYLRGLRQHVAEDA